MTRRFWELLLVAPLAMAGVAVAAGYSIYEADASATAQAGAFTARASNPSAVFYNAAGIADQRAGIAIGTTIITMSSEFNGDSPYPGLTAKENMKSQIFYPSNLYFIYPVKRITLGFGFFTPYGLGTAWDDDFPGRAISRKADIQSFYFNPVVATRFGKLTVGGGVQAVYSGVTLTRTARLPVASSSSVSLYDVAKLELEGDSGGLDWGFNLGARYEVTDMITVGASYRSEVKADLTGTAKFTDVHPLAQGTLPPTPADVETMLPFPAVISVGVAVQATPKLSIEADVNQMNWSVFESLGIEFTDPLYTDLNETIPEDYEDARSYRIGAEYLLTEKLALRGGYLFDESPVPSKSVSTLLPCADRYSLQLGVGYTMGRMNIDFAYMYLKFNDRSTEQSSSSGYNGIYTTSANLFGLTIGYSL